MGTVTERGRLALRQWAGEHMNELTAEGFMKSLPPKGWDDLATKSDIETLHAATKSDIARLDTKIEALETKVDTKTEALETKIDTLGTVLTATFTAQLATEIGAVRKEATRHFVTLIAALITLTAASLVGETVLPHYFPPPSLQAVQSSGE